MFVETKVNPSPILDAPCNLEKTKDLGSAGRVTFWRYEYLYAGITPSNTYVGGIAPSEFSGNCAAGFRRVTLPHGSAYVKSVGAPALGVLPEESVEQRILGGVFIPVGKVGSKQKECGSNHWYRMRGWDLVSDMRDESRSSYGVHLCVA
uniref:Amidase domain-containing protein n=1 Tax=Ascaris lumbricoides TaxID=6252 RepID=A0A0M3HP34_ASCLU